MPSAQDLERRLPEAVRKDLEQLGAAVPDGFSRFWNSNQQNTRGTFRGRTFEGTIEYALSADKKPTFRLEIRRLAHKKT
jgi:hypothetical protein